MNKKEDDFETLKDFNDYLEEVEEVTWNLILKTDVEATESRLRRWEEHQKAELNPNAIKRELEQSVPTDHVVLKKGATQRKNALAANTSHTTTNDKGEDVGFSFHGLKKRVAPPPEAPFDPFGGWSIAPQYYILQDDYDMRDFYNRSLREAFGGFGVFIEEEIEARAIPSMDAQVGTERAAVAATDVNMDDIF
jgi:CDK-activating kinase assembly factor MAT1